MAIVYTKKGANPIKDQLLNLFKLALQPVSRRKGKSSWDAFLSPLRFSYLSSQ